MNDNKKEENFEFYATSPSPNPLKRYDTTNMMSLMKDCVVVKDLYRNCVDASDTNSTFCSAVVTSYLSCSSSSR